MKTLKYYYATSMILLQFSLITQSYKIIVETSCASSPCLNQGLCVTNSNTGYS